MKTKTRKPWTAAQKKAARERWADRKSAKSQTKTLTANPNQVSDVEYESGPQTPPDEFEVMKKIASLLEPLNFNTKERISQYFASRFKY
jgi:hypothetical protein